MNLVQYLPHEEASGIADLDPTMPKHSKVCYSAIKKLVESAVLHHCVNCIGMINNFRCKYRLINTTNALYNFRRSGAIAPRPEEGRISCTDAMGDDACMIEMTDEELIQAYIKAAANESSPIPFGAEVRRKTAGDELIARGITEIRLPAFVDPFKVRGSNEDARKCVEPLVALGKEWG